MLNKALQRAAHIAGQYRNKMGPRPLARAKGKTGELYIYELIGAGFWSEGITAKAVADALDGMKDITELNVYINSEGGDVFEAKAIYNLLKRKGCPVNVFIDGIAASAATFIAMAGSTITTAPNATWMIHEVWTMAMGNASDLRAAADVIEKENSALVGMYAARTKNPEEQLKAWMAAETWFDAKEALEHGFTDKIGEEDAGESAKAAASKSGSPFLAAYQHTPERLLGKTAANAAKLAALDVSIMKNRASPGSKRTGQPGASTAK